MRHTLLGLAILACLLTSEVQLSACSCGGPQPPCQAAWQAAVVFVGEVVDIADTTPAERPDVSQGPFYYRRVSFRVTEVLRGDVTEGPAAVFTGQGGGDCGYAFDRRRSYIVYAHRSPQGQLSTGICSRTRPASAAGEDLEYLRGTARQPAGLGTIKGIARQPEIRPDQTYFHFEGSPPFAGGRVTLEPIDASPQPATPARYEALTGQDGRYTVRVPVGKYRASLAVRDGLYALPTMAAELIDPRGCAEVNFVVRPDGRIAGRVLDAEGRPVPALSIDLLPTADASRAYYNSFERVRTDAAGAFEFSRLAPGAYALGLTLRKELRAESTAIWITKETGGGPDPVNVAPEQRVWAGELTLPASVRLTTVSGTVAEADGAPARAARVYVLTAPAFGIAAGPIDVDANGGFSFTVIASRTYRLSAEVLGADRRWRKAESAAFEATAGLTPFALTMK